jgi:hypothetical protein
MLKKCVVLACTSLVGAVMIVGIVGCSPEKKPVAPGTGAAPADGGATPVTPTAPADDHK